MAQSGGLPTFQNPPYYEDALKRHGQFIRWVRTMQCPCVTETSQPNVRCTVCKGRGRVYKAPLPMVIRNEIGKHNNLGVVSPQFTPYLAGSMQVLRKGVPLPLRAVQPAGNTEVLLEYPYPQQWERIILNYTYRPDITVVGENSEVVGTGVIRTVAPRFTYLEKEYTGSLSAVTRVHNETKNETLVVKDFFKDYIYVNSMLSWEVGDVLAVDFVYMKPFVFAIFGVSPKTRYNAPWVLEEAQATLIAPAHCKVGADDLFTVLSAEHIAQEIIDPTVSAGNDMIKGYVDVSRILTIMLSDGSELGPEVAEVYDRDQIRWLIPKPTQKYTVQFMYHPTYVALQEKPMVRTAENKDFVTRVNVMRYEKMNDVRF